MRLAFLAIHPKIFLRVDTLQKMFVIVKKAHFVMFLQWVEELLISFVSRDKERSTIR